MLWFVCTQDREISQTALVSIQEYMLIKPSAHALHSIYALLDRLSLDQHLDLPPHWLLKLFNSVNFVLTTLTDLLKNNPSAFQMSANKWISTRQHIESVCLLWMAHPEPFIRSEIYTILDMVLSPCPPSVVSSFSSSISDGLLHVFLLSWLTC
jgi:hypothetical protein